MTTYNSIAYNQPYYFLQKSVEGYHLFLLSPLKAGRAMCFKRTLDFNSCWTVLLEEIDINESGQSVKENESGLEKIEVHTYNKHEDGSFEKEVILTGINQSGTGTNESITQHYLAQRIDFPIKQAATKKEIIIHTYVKNGTYLERSQMVIELKPKNPNPDEGQKAVNIQATQIVEPATGPIAYDVPYVHLYKSKFKQKRQKTDKTDKLCFYPRVLLCLKDYEPYKKAPNGILDDQAFINNKGSNAYTCIIPLVRRKNGESNIRMYSDLSVNSSSYFDSKTIDGYFEAIVARADNGEELDELIGIGQQSAGSFKEQRKYVINNFSNTPTTRSIGASAHIITGTPPANGANIVPATNLFIDQAT